MERGGLTVYDAEDLILAKNMLALAQESRDEDEVHAARRYLAEVRKNQDRTAPTPRTGCSVFVPVGRAQSELDNPDLDLDPRQAVCDDCRLVYWSPAGGCTNC